jgi:hypothetical protein
MTKLGIIEMVNNLGRGKPLIRCRGELSIRCLLNSLAEGGLGGSLVLIKLKEQKEPN